MNAKHLLALPAAAVAALLLAGCSGNAGSDDDLYGQDDAVGIDGPDTSTDSFGDVKTPSRAGDRSATSDAMPGTSTDSFGAVKTPSRAGDRSATSDAMPGTSTDSFGSIKTPNAGRGGNVVDNNVEADPDGTINTPGVNPEASPRDSVPTGRFGGPGPGDISVTSEPVRQSTGARPGADRRTTRTPEMADDTTMDATPDMTGGTRMDQNKDGMSGSPVRVRDVEPVERVDDAAVGIGRPTQNKDDLGGAEVELDRPATRPDAMQNK